MPLFQLVLDNCNVFDFCFILSAPFHRLLCCQFVSLHFMQIMFDMIGVISNKQSVLKNFFNTDVLI